MRNPTALYTPFTIEPTGAEHRRLEAHRKRQANWRLWGPYLSDRAWATVREDYSAGGDAWQHFPHEHARSRAYRWTEDGIGGISDRHQYLCFAVALWNGRDPILKERLFGLTGLEGNHGEDVKECYFYLDSTPTHSYMKMLYKYPQAAYPYADLVASNGRRDRLEPEHELLDTDLFGGDRYFDVFIEYAKADEADILIRITAVNQGPAAARCALLPTLWFRNTWSWGYPRGPMGEVAAKPAIEAVERGAWGATLRAEHSEAGTYYLYARGDGAPLFTENESNHERLFGVSNDGPFVKDAFHRYLVHGERDAVNLAEIGTKAAILFDGEIGPAAQRVVELRLCQGGAGAPFMDFETVFEQRIDEADAFYASVQSGELGDEGRAIQRQAFAGLLWNKQFYYLDLEQWLTGDPVYPAPPGRGEIRNGDWEHLVNFDVISMPDKWEYPWYACWDLAFHCLPLAMIDVDYAKRQLELMTREWYMHPNGQLPAYEWSFGDANPPVHAWAVWRVYKIEQRKWERTDRPFLEGCYHKLLLNFTWWVNRKDYDDRNIFQGGFLGLDNIGVFDRSKELPTGGHLDQADGTAWMGAYCLTMMKIALELAREEPVYQDAASKFFEHFMRVAHAMTHLGGQGLWDEQDGFFYDVLHLPGGVTEPIRARSLVGLLPLFAVETLEPQLLEDMPTFARRMSWFVTNRPHLSKNMTSVDEEGVGRRRLVALLTRDRLVRVLKRMLDEEEFLSPYGIRSLSKAHQDDPYELTVNGQTYRVDYQPAESQTDLFGGNSNWRGPVWFPINHLIIEALQRFDHFYGEDLTVECPTGSGQWMTLGEVACELSRRLISLFLPGEDGLRPYQADRAIFRDPHWRDYVLFYEYFHADHGKGLGASHQTGWTALVAKLLQQSALQL